MAKKTAKDRLLEDIEKLSPEDRESLLITLQKKTESTGGKPAGCKAPSKTSKVNSWRKRK